MNNPPKSKREDGESGYEGGNWGHSLFLGPGIHGFAVECLYLCRENQICSGHSCPASTSAFRGNTCFPCFTARFHARTERVGITGSVGDSKSAETSSKAVRLKGRRRRRTSNPVFSYDPCKANNLETLNFPSSTRTVPSLSFSPDMLPFSSSSCHTQEEQTRVDAPARRLRLFDMPLPQMMHSGFDDGLRART